MSELTLIEASKSIIEDEKKVFVQVYGQESHVLSQLAVPTITGDNVKWSHEDTTGTIGNRAVGEDYTADNGSSKPYAAGLKIYGGTISVDRYTAENFPNSVVQMELSKVKALSRKFTVEFFEGAGNKALRGLRKWAQTKYTSQNIRLGTTSAGDFLTMPKMDAALDQANIVPGRTFIYCNQKPANALTALMRANNQIAYTVNEQGIRSQYYNGIPVIVLKDGNKDPLLSEVEDGSSTNDAISGGTATSIYIVTYGPEDVEGFQGAMGMLVENVKDKTNFRTTLMEWHVGVAPRGKHSFVRLFNVKNTALIA